MAELTVGSLFSGIGGLDLGLERAGMRVIWQSEIDSYACRVLKKHWPEVANHGNIKEINWSEVEQPDVLCGGYPCQPFSTAGKRKGEADSRHLWPWVRTAISELRPRYAILENVRGHLSLGGLSVIAELAAIGYDAEWRIVSAASVGANHRRDRIIIVAYPNGCNEANGGKCQAVSSQNRSRRDDRGGSGSNLGEVSMGSSGQSSKDVAYPNDARPHRAEVYAAETRQHAFGGAWGCSSDVADADSTPRQHQHHGQVCEPDIGGCGADVADTHSKRQQKSLCTGTGVFTISDAWRSSPELRSICKWWETEPDVGRVAHGIPSRVDRLRGLGNAVVPQVAEVIGRLVVAHAEQTVNN